MFSANSVEIHPGTLTIGLRVIATVVPEVHGSQNTSAKNARIGSSLKEHNKVLLELKVAMETLVALSERHATCFEEMQAFILVLTARQT